MVWDGNFFLTPSSTLEISPKINARGKE